MKGSGREVLTVAALGFVVAGVVAVTGCGSSDGGNEAAAGAAEQQAAAPASTAVRSACDVLTADDASAILGQKLEARPDPEDQGPRHSTCGYYPPSPDSYGVLYLTVYWSGGQDEWNTWQMATSMAGKTWEQTEKVSLDSINKAGPVGGLGDRAYFGGLLPSLVLQGDVLLEYKLALVPDEAQNFPRLAKAALARL